MIEDKMFDDSEYGLEEELMCLFDSNEMDNYISRDIEIYE